VPFRIPTFYNLSLPVGKGKANSLLDVMLVQFFLKEIESEFRAPDSKLPMDGRVDPITLDWILAFQKSNRYLYADGVVDPVPERNLTAQTPVHNKEFTIYELNRTFESKQPQTFNRIWEHPRCPGPLGQFLQATFSLTHP
jgi:hypothetical protein